MGQGNCNTWPKAEREPKSDGAALDATGCPWCAYTHRAIRDLLTYTASKVSV